MTTIDAEALAEELADAVLAVDHAEMDCRSGRQPWGYVDPTDAACDATRWSSSQPHRFVR